MVDSGGCTVFRISESCSVGVEGDWNVCELWDSDVAVGGNAGSSTLPVCPRTVQSGSCMVCRGPPSYSYSYQRLRFSRYLCFRYTLYKQTTKESAIFNEKLKLFG